MKAALTLVGALLIVLGVVSLGYQGFTYTTREKVAQLGSLELTTDTQKTVYLSPLVGGGALIAGLALVLIGRKGGN